MRTLTVVWFLLVLSLTPLSLSGANYVFVFHSPFPTISIFDADTLRLLGTPTVGIGAVKAFGLPDPANPSQFLKFYVIKKNSVVVLNSKDLSVGATLPLSGTLATGPNAAALTGDGRRLLVAGANQIHVVNTTDDKVLLIPTSSTPSGIGVLPNSRRAYVISSGSPVVQIIDLTPDPPQLRSTTINLGAPATAVGVAPNGSRIYVATSTSVYDIDRVTNAPATPIPNPAGASSVVFDPDAPVSRAALSGGGASASILNLATRTIGSKPFTAGGSLTISTVVLPGADRAFLLAAEPAGFPGHLYQGLLSAGGATSEVIDPRTSRPFGPNIIDMEASPDGSRLFVAIGSDPRMVGGPLSDARLIKFDPSGSAAPVEVTPSLDPSGLSVVYSPAAQATVLEIYGGDNQTAPVNTTFPATLAVRARDSTSAFKQAVTFSSTSPGVTLSDPSSTTNLLGVAETQVSVSVTTQVQVQAALASGDSIPPVTFNIKAVAQPGNQLLVVSGNNQTVPLGQAAAQPLVVRVQDDHGIDVPGATVTFTVTGGSATLSAPNVTTDAQGRASVTVQAGNALGTITVTATAIGKTVTFIINTIGRVPVVTNRGFVNGASFRVGWVPGSLGSIFGVGLMEEVSGVVQASVAPFPTTLRGVRVTVAGIDAPLISLANMQGQEQINLQVPANIPATGTVTVIITNNGSSATFTGVQVLPAHPGIFEFLDSGGVTLAAALHADFSVVTQANPARKGEVILLFLTGLGATVPPVGTNVPGPTPAAQTVTQPVVGINGEGTVVLGSFYAPTLYTAYQINFLVPQNARSGLATLSVVAAGVASQDSRIPIQ